MNTAHTVQAKRDALHYMMHTAFIEIRASNSLNAAKKFADVFHNLPMSLLNCRTGEDYDAEFSKLLERARQWELHDYLQQLIGVATKAVAATTSIDKRGADS